jgi:hypothetical protein
MAFDQPSAFRPSGPLPALYLAVMAGLTDRGEVSRVEELSAVATVWLPVMYDLSTHDPFFIDQTVLAQRFLPELVGAQIEPLL